MLKLDSNKDKIDRIEYSSNINYNTKVYIDVDKLMLDIVPDKANVDGSYEAILSYMNLVSEEKIDVLTPATLVNFLVKYEDIPQREFEYYDYKSNTRKVTGKFEVIEKVYKSNKARYILDRYISYASNNTKVDNMYKNIERLQCSGLRTNEGKDLKYLPFRYKEAKTGRNYSSNSNLQALPVKYCNTFSAPEDYFILWGDFKQIDLRVALNICLRDEDDPVMTKYLQTVDDNYEVFTRALHDSLGVEFDHSKFIKDREKYKEGILSSVYGAQVPTLTKSMGDPKLASMLAEYINLNPGYVKYKNSIAALHEHNEAFKSYGYFGSERTLIRSGDRAWTAALNNPIQSTSGEIIILYTNEVCRRMYNHGIPKSKFYHYLNRHDEVLFMVHKDAMEYIYEALDCMKIQVDDWSMLEIEWDVGYHYMEGDKDLRNKVLKIAHKHPETMVSKTKRNVPYKPVDEVVVFDLFRENIEGKQYYAVYDWDIKLGIFSYENIKDDGALVQRLIYELRQASLISKNTKRIYLKCDKDYYMDYHGIEVYFLEDLKNTMTYSRSVFTWMVSRYEHNKNKNLLSQGIKRYSKSSLISLMESQHKDIRECCEGYFNSKLIDEDALYESMVDEFIYRESYKRLPENYRDVGKRLLMEGMEMIWLIP